MISKKEHKNIEGIHKLIGIKTFLNQGLSEDLKISFPNVVPVERPAVVLPETLNPYWFAGFTSGEGCFSVEVTKSSSHKIGYQVRVVFIISQQTRDLELLKSFINFLGGGLIKERAIGSEFVLTKFILIKDKLVPLFQKYPIRGVKF